ncbi:hypothetical protein [Paenibacillus amylolyticus]|uniref:hypothetical protein n=1 Tax=Paenibacillus amylolyticus TaxID=1451 RepID=UPI003EBB8695
MTIAEDLTYWVNCNNPDVYKDPNSEQVVNQITGIRKIAVLKVDKDWILIKFKLNDNDVSFGWMKKDVLTRNKFN